MNFIPACHFPTTVLFIDDNKPFLNNLFVNLQIKSLVYKPFTTPYAALNYLNDHCPPQPFLTKLVSQADETQWEHRSLDVNIDDLHREVYNAARFNQVSTVVVDYDMPGLNGLEFCAQITVPHIRKIMLTGAADENLAVEAFNRGLIHKFINKNSKDLDIQLNAALEQSVNDYFHDISQVFIHTLNVNWGTALTDPAFIDLFHKIVQDQAIVEYYLFQGIGSFLLLDKFGKDYGLFIKEEKELQAILESEEIETATPDIQRALTGFDAMLCYHNQQDCSLPQGTEWAPYVHKTESLRGRKPYYYCLVPHILDLERHKIHSFEAYKKEDAKNS